jgi:2-polyprenyl-3-methyl-5-hydroxy-6-metoxy-1,4-benzoquinol methylase
MATTVHDQEKVEAFAGRVIGDFAGTMATVLSILGDRLGLFRVLAEGGPATSAELAERAGISERYAREWLAGLASAGYLEYEPDGTRFALPPEHIPSIAQERGPLFVCGGLQMLKGMLSVVDRLPEAFRSGGGIPQSAYADETWDGMERFTDTWFENLLLEQWIPAVPEVQARLEEGCTLADVGCGRGKALVKLAQAFPRSRFVGYDVFGPSVETARAAAVATGVAERVTVFEHDASTGLPERFDVITTFDVVHDAVAPRMLLRSIREALADDGTYLLLEINASDRVEGNAGPLGTIFYGFSVLYCMTTSLADGGEGLGTCGMHEHNVRALCAEAGFGCVERLPLENPFNVLYAVKP